LSDKYRSNCTLAALPGAYSHCLFDGSNIDFSVAFQASMGGSFDSTDNGIHQIIMATYFQLDARVKAEFWLGRRNRRTQSH
jgi:hypothetical protein